MTGVEPATFSLEVHTSGNPIPCNNSELSKEAQGVVAPVVAEQSETPPVDPDLARIAQAWEKLPVAVRAGIMAIVNTSGGE